MGETNEPPGKYEGMLQAIYLYRAGMITFLELINRLEQALGIVPKQDELCQTEVVNTER